MIIQLYGKVICALKSPVREIATIGGTSIHQKKRQNLLQPLGKRARSMYKNKTKDYV